MNNRNNNNAIYETILTGMGNDYWDQRKQSPYRVKYSAEAPIFLPPHDLDVKHSLLPIPLMTSTAFQDE